MVDDSPKEAESLLPKHGGYRKLRSFQLAQLVYDVTVRFCDRYISKYSRTHDQMVQAARSGVQNIAEGSQASGTSRKMELKLTNVARASLEELKLDYEDFLRQRELKEWSKNDPRRQALVQQRCQTADEVAAWVKKVHDGQDGLDGRYRRDGQDGHYGRDGRDGRNGRNGPDKLDRQNSPDKHDGHNIPDKHAEALGESISSIESIPSILSIKTPKSISSIKTPSPPTPCPESYSAIAANAALVLIGVAVTLLDRQLKAQADTFTREGGFTEKLYKTRINSRNQPK